jgi:hypothetical protein
MSLKQFKKLINIDQQNVLICEVVTDLDSYTNVRTPTGKTVRAGKSDGSSFEKGSLVEVRTDKRIFTIVGTSSYADYSAERAFTL